MRDTPATGQLALSELALVAHRRMGRHQGLHLPASRRKRGDISYHLAVTMHQTTLPAAFVDEATFCRHKFSIVRRPSAKPPVYEDSSILHGAFAVPLAIAPSTSVLPTISMLPYTNSMSLVLLIAPTDVLVDHAR